MIDLESYVHTYNMYIQGLANNTGPDIEQMLAFYTNHWAIFLVVFSRNASFELTQTSKYAIPIGQNMGWPIRKEMQALE